MTWRTKSPLPRILKGVAAAWLLAALPVFTHPAHANNWGEMAMISETLGVFDSRICIGEASRGDLGCPTYSPTISSTGRINASAGLTVNSVSLSTTGTTWGYLGSGASYLPNLSSNAISATNISATSLTVNGIPVTGSAATDRLVSGSNVLRLSNSGSSLDLLTTGSARLNVLGGATNEASLELGNGRTGNGFSYIDLVGDTTYSDYGLRLIRDNAGPNSNSWLQHRGTGGLHLSTQEAAPISLVTNWTERMRITPDGSVGIGTSVPLSNGAYGWLTLNGSAGGILSQSSNNSEIFRIQSIAGIATYINVVTTTTPLVFSTSNAERMRINSTGNVGIGTSTPAHPLDVSGTVRATSFIGNGSGLTGIAGDNLGNHTATAALVGTVGTVALPGYTFSGDTNTGMYWVAADQIGLTTGGARRALISSAGLTVTGAVDASTQFLGNAADTAAAPSFSWTGNTNVGMFRPTTDVLAFSTNGAERMRVLANGNVGVGTTAPAHPLDVNGTVRATAFSTSGGLTINNSAPTITLQDTDHRSGFIHMNANLMYFLSSNANNATGWTQNGAHWPLILDMTNDGAVFGGNVSIPEGELYVGSNINAQGGNIALSTGAANYWLMTKRSESYAPASEINNLVFSYWNGSSWNQSVNVTPNGNVGLGTAVPAHRLDVNGTVRATAFIGNGSGLTGIAGDNLGNHTATAALVGTTGTVALPGYTFSGDTNTGMYWVAADQIGLTTGGTRRALISSAGLTVTGAVDASTQFLGNAADTAATPSFSWTGDTNTGLFAPAADTLALSTNSAERLRVTSAGNVGIGTTSPAHPLDVSGIIRASGEIISTNANQFRMVQGNYGAFWRNDGSNLYLLLTDSGNQYGNWNSLRPFEVNLATGNVNMSHNLRVGGTVSATAFVGDGSGLTGIAGDNLGNHTATAALVGTVGTVALPGYTFSGDTNTGMYWVAADQIGLTTGGTRRALISSAGLTVTGAVDASTQFLGNAADTAAAPSFSWTGNTNVGMFRPTTDVLAFSTNGAERMRVLANGNVGVGTTAPAHPLDVNGTVRATSFVGNGAGLTNITASNADTLDGLDSTAFVRKTGDTMTGSLSVPYLSVAANGAEGGEIQLNKGSGQTNLAGNVHIDTATDQVRVYEGGGAYRQFNFNLINGSITGPAGTFWQNSNDGSGSGLDADLLDGLNSSEFIRRVGNPIFTLPDTGMGFQLSSFNASGELYVALYNPGHKTRFVQNATGYCDVSSFVACVSDARFKSIQRVMTDNVDKFKHIDSIIYKWNGKSEWGDTDELHMGLLAQQIACRDGKVKKAENGLYVVGKDGLLECETERLFPEAVQQTTTTLKDNSTVPSLTASYSALVAPLIGAVNELKAENDALKAANDNHARELQAIREEIRALKAR